MTGAPSLAQARRLLVLSRRVGWKFPTSSGTPVPLGASAGRLVQNRAALLKAARQFAQSGQPGEAAELAARLWRIWMLPPRDLKAGQAFLKAALAKGGGAPRWRGLKPAFGQAPLHMGAQANRLAGNYGRAAALFRKSLALNLKVGDKRMAHIEMHNLGHVECRRGQAALAFARGNRSDAAKLCGRARAILKKSRVTLATDDASELAWLRRRLRRYTARR